MDRATRVKNTGDICQPSLHGQHSQFKVPTFTVLAVSYNSSEKEQERAIQIKALKISQKTIQQQRS